MFSYFFKHKKQYIKKLLKDMFKNKLCSDEVKESLVQELS